MDLSQAIFTEHALQRMSERKISHLTVREMLSTPVEVIPVKPGRVVVQKTIGQHLYRIFIDINIDPPEVVTVYLTSKIDKYESRS